MTELLSTLHFSPLETKSIIHGINISNLTPSEASWVINNIPAVVTALNKNGLSLTHEGNIERGLLLEEIGVEITSKNLYALQSTFQKLNALNQGKSSYWDNVSYHVLGVFLAVKGIPSGDMVSLFSNMYREKLTSVEVFDVLKKLKKLPEIPHSLDSLTTMIKKQERLIALPKKGMTQGKDLNLSSEIKKSNHSEAFKALLIGKMTTSSTSDFHGDDKKISSPGRKITK